MASLPNLTGRTGADYVANEATPGLTLLNQGTGPGLAVDSAVVSAASVAILTGSPVIRSNVTTANLASFNRTVIGSPSVSSVVFSVSGASIPVLEFQANALVSCVSIVFAASANWAGLSAVRVKFSDGTTYGWIPVLPSATVTAAAI